MAWCDYPDEIMGSQISILKKKNTRSHTCDLYAHGDLNKQQQQQQQHLIGTHTSVQLTIMHTTCEPYYYLGLSMSAEGWDSVYMLELWREKKGLSTEECYVHWRNDSLQWPGPCRLRFAIQFGFSFSFLAMKSFWWKVLF